MPRRSVTRLRENPAAASGAPRVIDARYTVVGKRTILGGAARFLMALLLAALIGALVPIAWVLTQEVAAVLEG
jgi:hypothetical protein